MNASDNRAFADIAARAQHLANERGGDYSALTLDELCAFMVAFDEALSAARASDRDLAEAIHHEIISPESVEDALLIWREIPLEHPEWDARKRIWFLLASISHEAIDAVLARRLREAARTGPWDTP